MSEISKEKKFYYIMVLENVITGEIKAERFYIFDRNIKIARHEAQHIFLGFSWNFERGWKIVTVVRSACSIATNNL